MKYHCLCLISYVIAFLVFDYGNNNWCFILKKQTRIDQIVKLHFIC